MKPTTKNLNPAGAYIADSSSIGNVNDNLPGLLSIEDFIEQNTELVDKLQNDFGCIGIGYDRFGNLTFIYKDVFDSFDADSKYPQYSHESREDYSFSKGKNKPFIF